MVLWIFPTNCLWPLAALSDVRLWPTSALRDRQLSGKNSQHYVFINLTRFRMPPCIHGTLFEDTSAGLAPGQAM